MKNLIDIIEKLKVDDIKLNIDFPIDASYDEQLEYLKKHKFKIVTLPKDINYMRELVDFLNDEKCKICCINDLSDSDDDVIPVIRMADTSKHAISKDNPMFMIYKENGKMNYIIVYTGYLSDHVMPEKWLNELNKYFKL